MYFILKSLVFSALLDSVFSYTAHSALYSVVFTTNHFPPEDIHSEYYFGKCSSNRKVLIVKHSYTYNDVKNHIIIRAPLLITAEPKCIYLRGKSIYSEIIRYHAFKFNICICRLIYNYSGLVFEHYYYEWYIPVEMMEGIVWEIYFYE